MASATTKVGLVEEFGGPEKIVVKEEATPSFGDSQVLIKVEYAGVNFVDTHLRSGWTPPGMSGAPRPLGMEVAGIVAGVGKDVSHVKEGDKVAAITGAGYATYAVALGSKTAKVPGNVSTREAAATLLQGLTVLPMITEAYCVKENDFCVVHSSAGGVGQLLVQALVKRGAIVIALASTPEKLEIAKGLGAQHTVLNTGDWASEVLKLTERDGEDGAHVVYDPVGQATWAGTLACVRRKGTVVSFGAASGFIPPVDTSVFAPRAVKFLKFSFNIYTKTAGEFAGYAAELYGLVGSGALHVPIFKEYDFTAEGLAQAHRDITSRGTTGKLLVRIAP